jgi:hypothetical protein
MEGVAMSTSVTTTVTGSPSSIALSALREIVAAGEGMPDDTSVTLYVDPYYNQLDRGSSSLSLTREVK